MISSCELQNLLTKSRFSCTCNITEKMGWNSCNVKQKLRKGLWSPEEDEKLHSYITRFGVGCWSSVPKLAGLQRCGKSCRLRWINYLRPDLKRGMFSQDEENLIINLHEALGNRWAQIAAQLPGRTDNEIKNFWNSCLKKKLIKQGIDPNTHKPTIANEANNDYEEKLDDSSSVSHRQIILQPTVLEQQHQQTYSNTVPTAVREINLGGNSKQVYDPLFLPEFQANVDPHGYNYSSFLSHNNCGIFNSMPNLTSFDNRNVMDIESSSKGSSTIQMMINGGDVVENKFDSPMLFEYDRFSGIPSIDQDQQHKLLCQSSQDFSDHYPLMTSLSDQPLITDDQPNLQDHALFHDHI